MYRMLFSAALASAFALPAGATVLDGAILRQSGNGVFVELSTETAFDVGQDNFNTCHLYAFNEDQNILLSEPVRVDIGGGDDGLIAAGTTVASHYVFLASQFHFSNFTTIRDRYVKHYF